MDVVGKWVRTMWKKKSSLCCALALAKGNLWLNSGPMVRNNCHGMTVSTLPWQLCRTIVLPVLHSQVSGDLKKIWQFELLTFPPNRFPSLQKCPYPILVGSFFQPLLQPQSPLITPFSQPNLPLLRIPLAALTCQCLLHVYHFPILTCPYLGWFSHTHPTFTGIPCAHLTQPSLWTIWTIFPPLLWTPSLA